MGRFDDITHDQLRSDLVAFARLVLRLDREDGVLVSPADLQRILGELRQKLFAYEIRSTKRSAAPNEVDEADRARAHGASVEPPDPAIQESLKVVRDAIRRSEEMLREWDGHSTEATDDDE